MPKCPFENSECKVTCACGDVECHRYCQVSQPRMITGPFFADLCEHEIQVSKYCTQCGVQIRFECSNTQCKRLGASGTSFCGACGWHLSIPVEVKSGSV